jgi:hypothetical protein
MIFTAREDTDFRAPGLAELQLRRLADADARAVLDAHVVDLPRHVRDLLLREAAGNPLALVEPAAAHRAGRLDDYPLGPPDAGRGGAGRCSSARAPSATTCTRRFRNRASPRGPSWPASTCPPDQVRPPRAPACAPGCRA